MSDCVVRLKRADVIDTSEMTEVMIGLNIGRARSEAEMPDELARLIGRVVMGQAVRRAELECWGVRVARLCRIDEPDGPPAGG